MEAHVVQAVGGTGAEIVLPRSHIHCDVTSQRPYAGVVLATQEEPMAVGVEVLAFDMEVAEVGMDG